MEVEAGFVRTSPVFILAPSGECHQYKVGAPGKRPYLARRVVAVEFRHPDVEQYDFGSKRRADLERRQSIRRGPRLIAHHVEHHRHAFDRVLVVVCDQDAASDRRSVEVGRLLMRSKSCCLDDRDRQFHDEFATSAQPGTLGLDRAAMHFDQPSNNRQSDP